MRGPGDEGCFNTRKNSGGGGSVPASEQKALTPTSKTLMQARITAPSPSASPWRTSHLLGGPRLQGESRACCSWDPASLRERRNSLPPNFQAHTTCRRTQRPPEATYEGLPARESPSPSSATAIP